MPDLIDSLCDTLALSQLVGQSPAFARAIRSLPILAKSDATVFVRGETGTGKELAARALHYLSARAARPFLAVNCAALPDTLLEAELFGHERGAFTGAQGRRIGLIREADGGTLFLDEVNCLTARAQAALLRVLQERRLRPVGASSDVTVDIRIIVATNAPVEQLVRDHAFRQDLYYRLTVFTLELPPLRERAEDILPLARHFLEKHAPENRCVSDLAAAASAALVAHVWPGNVRKLENAMIRASHLCQNGTIEPGDLGLPALVDAPPRLEGPHSFGKLRKDAIERFERAYLSQLLDAHRGNVSRAARAAGKDRRDLGRLLRKHGIVPGAFRTHTSVR